MVVSMTKETHITILIASYNRLAFLAECVQSCLDQKYSHFDVLIVDDGSGEETRNWLEQLQQPNIEVIFQKNSGVAKARQTGLQHARGKYLCILDSDDRLCADALVEMVSYIKNRPDTAIFYTNNKEIHPNGKLRNSSYRQCQDTDSFTRDVMISLRVPFKHSGTVFKKDVAVALGGYDANLKCKIDIDFILKFSTNGYLPILIEKPLVHFNFHKDSISRNRWKGIKCWFIILRRYTTDMNPLKRAVIILRRTMLEFFKSIYERVVL